MRVRFEHRAGAVIVHPDAGAEVLEDFFEDMDPAFLREAVAAAKTPEKAPEDDSELAWAGNHIRCGVARAHVLVENDFTEQYLMLRHGEFIKMVEGYLALLDHPSDTSTASRPKAATRPWSRYLEGPE